MSSAATELEQYIAYCVDRIEIGKSKNPKKKEEIKKRDMQVVSMNLGFDGKGGMSLEETSQEMNILRESVRQISGKAKAEIAKIEIPQLVVDVSAIIDESLPCSIKHLDKVLVESGHMTKGNSSVGILNFIDAILAPTTFSKIIQIEFTKYAITPTISKIKNIHMTLRTAAVKDVSHNGASSLGRISLRVFGEDNPRYYNIIRELIADLDGIEYLSNDFHFFLGCERRNRLVNLLNKIFSEYRSVSVFDIQRVMLRAWKKNSKKQDKGEEEGFKKDNLIDYKIILEIAKRIPQIRVEGDLIVADTPTEMGHSSSLELTILGIISKAPGQSIREKKIEDKVREALGGKIKWAFAMALNYSPLFAHKTSKSEDDFITEERGNYALIGELRA